MTEVPSVSRLPTGQFFNPLAARYLKDLAAMGVLRETQLGKEKLFIHPKLMELLVRDSNEFVPYDGMTNG